MPIFMNPFQKHDISDFPDVYVPLSHATRKASVAAVHDRRKSSASDSPVNDEAGKANVASTVEELRVEVDNGKVP